MSNETAAPLEGNDVDREYFDEGYWASELAEILKKSGIFLAQLVGDEIANDAMADIFRRASNLGRDFVADDWAAKLEDDDSAAFEWEMGLRFNELGIYANRGIVAAPTETPEEHQAYLSSLLAEAAEFLAMVPFVTWGIGQGYGGLAYTLRLAQGRWALDNLEPITPEALAAFGGISEGRMRNLMAGEGRTFSNIDGKIPASEALQWLKGRKTFFPSVWRRQGRYDVHKRYWEAPEDKIWFVPVAKDGTVFHPGLSQNGKYRVGSRQAEREFESYEEALSYLQRLSIPAWRRPTPLGSWTIVTAARWDRMNDWELAQAGNQQKSGASQGNGGLE